MLPQVKLNDFIHAVSIPDTVESIPRFSKSIFRNSPFFKPKVVFLGFTWFCPLFFEPSIFGNSGRDFTNKFCFLSKICTRFLEPENSGAKKNWS